MPSPDVTDSTRVRSGSLRCMTKTCVRCHEAKDFPEFHADPRSSDGRASACKACITAQRQARRLSETPEQRAERRARSREHTARYRSARTEEARTGRVYDPAKTRARRAVAWARTHGLLVPLGCTTCGAVGAIHGHHHNGYEPEHWLDVTWLCPACHGEEHRL